MNKVKEQILLERVDAYRWRIPQSYQPAMHVPGLVYAMMPSSRIAKRSMHSSKWLMLRRSQVLEEHPGPLRRKSFTFDPMPKMWRS